MRVAIACSLLLGASAFAQCEIGPIDSPTIIFSYDYYELDQFGFEYLSYIDGGAAEVVIQSSPGYCVQLSPGWDTTTPLALVYFAFPDAYTTDFLFADTGGYVPFYPYGATASYYSFGINLQTGFPIYGQGWVFLTVFKIGPY